MSSARCSLRHHACACGSRDMTQLPIPIHVGSEPPEYWDDVEARQRQFGDEASPWLQKQRRLTVASPTVDWGGFGFEPRWVGFDTADCAAALQPSIFSGHGADEFDRFARAPRAVTSSRWSSVRSATWKTTHEVCSCSTTTPFTSAESIRASAVGRSGRAQGCEPPQISTTPTATSRYAC